MCRRHETFSFLRNLLTAKANSDSLRAPCSFRLVFRACEHRKLPVPAKPILSLSPAKDPPSQQKVSGFPGQRRIKQYKYVCWWRMIPAIPKADDFKDRLNTSLQLASLKFPTIHINKHQPVYVCGDPAETVYFIESGQVKLLMLSPEGKECLLAIHTTGDIFGELCLAGSIRQETAIAMEDTKLKRFPCANFFQNLRQNSLVEGFVRYLTVRVGDQQRVIASLITVDSEHRLGETLLYLAHKLGQPDPRNTRIEHKITHEELAEMVGTTRPRITSFMLKFRARGLIEITPEHFLVIREKKLSDYLGRARLRPAAESSRPARSFTKIV